MYSSRKFEAVEVAETVTTQDEARALIGKLRENFDLGIEFNDQDLHNTIAEHTAYYMRPEKMELAQTAEKFQDDLISYVKRTKKREIKVINDALDNVVNERDNMLPLVTDAIARLEQTGWDYDLFIEGPGGKFSLSQVGRDAGIETRKPGEGPLGPRTAAQAESMARAFGEGIAENFPGKVTFTLTHTHETFYDFDQMVLHGEI